MRSRLFLCKACLSDERDSVPDNLTYLDAVFALLLSTLCASATIQSRWNKHSYTIAAVWSSPPSSVAAALLIFRSAFVSYPSQNGPLRGVVCFLCRMARLAIACHRVSSGRVLTVFCRARLLRRWPGNFFVLFTLPATVDCASRPPLLSRCQHIYDLLSFASGLEATPRGNAHLLLDTEVKLGSWFRAVFTLS